MPVMEQGSVRSYTDYAYSAHDLIKFFVEAINEIK